MYHLLVAHRVRLMWKAANAADLDTVLADFAPTFEYTSLAGDTPLSAECTTLDELTEHFVTAALTFPGTVFDVDSVLVNGWPWFTRVVAVVDVTAPLPDGSRYVNQMVQYVHLRWGKVVRVRALLDVQKLEDALARVGVDNSAPATTSSVGAVGAEPLVGATPLATVTPMTGVAR
jgi:ketosteroid isomerase-like protein